MEREGRKVSYFDTKVNENGFRWICGNQQSDLVIYTYPANAMHF